MTWKVQRGWRTSEARTFGCLCVATLSRMAWEDGVDRFAGWDGGLDGVEEANELTVPVALYAAAEHGTCQDVEGGKQRRRPMTSVVVGLGDGMAGSERTVGAGPLQRPDLALLIEGQHHPGKRSVTAALCG